MGIGGECTFKAVGRHNHEQGRTQGHEEMGTKARRLVAVFAFQSDGTAKESRDENPQNKL